ncbi:MAG: MGMT family protein [Oscillospiraceae bacterium]|nr:MGMT family protein [Oscillospiraceae bacterium]
MRKVLDEQLIYEILSVVNEIPCGKVASYGQIARLIGRRAPLILSERPGAVSFTGR